MATVAVSLEHSDFARIASSMPEIFGTKASVTVHVDESILDGLVIQMGDRMQDGTARTRLRRLRIQL